MRPRRRICARSSVLVEDDEALVRPSWLHMIRFMIMIGDSRVLEYDLSRGIRGISVVSTKIQVTSRGKQLLVSL